MKLHTASYLIKEGAKNVFRNKLMSLASISIIIVSLLVFGVFYVIIYDLNINTRLLKEQPHVVVWADENLADYEVDLIADYLNGNAHVAGYEFLSKEYALEQVKEILGENADILEGFGEGDFLRPGFMVELQDPENSSTFVQEISKVYGVAKVEYSQKWIGFIISVGKWVQGISVILIAVFFLVAVFIISNTVKLTVFARKHEISIMKYIGAADWFIRWPFVIEGIVIGVIGSAVAYVGTCYAYKELYEYLNANIVNFGTDLLKLATVQEIALGLAFFYSILGMLVGALGSILSMRKYLKV
ncbi:MAG: permease-like cell division protein FtsX [Eubacteriales bacterium]|nr:permease-like cell division protein FtsX [Eubacteriales bacterium]